MDIIEMHKQERIEQDRQFAESKARAIAEGGVGLLQVSRYRYMVVRISGHSLCHFGLDDLIHYSTETPKPVKWEEAIQVLRRLKEAKR